MKKISVVIPLYNKSYSIEKCLRSVINQTIKPSEIIVVNDGSTDDSVKIVENISEKFTDVNLRIINQDNNGVSSARNKGITNSREEYIALLDADDEWKPHFIEKAIILIEDFPEAILYTFKHEVHDETGIYIPNQEFNSNQDRGYIENFFQSSKKGSIVNSSKVVINKRRMNTITLFPEEATITEDLYLWSKLALNGKFAYDNTVAVRVNREQDLSRINRKNKIPFIIKYYSNNKLEMTSDLKEYLSIVHLNHLINSKLNKNNYEFLLRWKNGLSLFPIKSFFLIFILFIPSFVFPIAKMIKTKLKAERIN